jgi:hypothetical protein
MPNEEGTAEKISPRASLVAVFVVPVKMRAETSSSPLATTRTAPRMPVRPKREGTALSYTFVCPGAMLSLDRTGLSLARPDWRNCISKVIVDDVGFVTQIEVTNCVPSAPCTWPAAGTMRSVPVNAVAWGWAKRGEQRKLRTSNRTAGRCGMGTSPLGTRVYRGQGSC